MKSRNYFQCAGQCCHSTCQLKAALIWAPTEQVTQACDAPSLQLATHSSRNLQLSHVLSGWRRRREVTTSGWRKMKGTCSVLRKGAWQWAIDSFCNIRILTIWTSLCIIFVFSPLIELICALSLKNLHQEDNNWNHGNRVSPNGKSRMEPPKWNIFWHLKFSISAKKVDNISLFCYFFSFSVFNAFYWSDLLSKHHNFR